MVISENISCINSLVNSFFSLVAIYLVHSELFFFSASQPQVRSKIASISSDESLGKRNTFSTFGHRYENNSNSSPPEWRILLTYTGKFPLFSK